MLLWGFMSFNRILNEYKRSLQLFAQIGRQKLIQFDISGTKCRADINFDASPDIEMILRQVCHSFSAIVETYLSAQAIAFGPKIFKIDQLDCEALENMDINISFEDYFQPFETVIIEFPDKYVLNKTVPCEDAGKFMFGEIVPPNHHPDFAIINWQKHIKTILFGLYLTSGQVLTSSLFGPENSPIEGIIKDHGFIFRNSLDVSQEENNLLCQLFRTSVNVMLMTSVYGLQKKGPENPSHHNRLQGYLLKAQKAKDPERITKVQNELRYHPILYSFKQDVKLYHKVGYTNAEHTGLTVRPHWRRGHYQHYKKWNADRTEKVRVLKAKLPILVNKSRYLGEEGDTQVVYHA